MAELIRVYLHGDETKPVEGQPLNAGISGAAALEQLEKFNGPGGMQDPSGTFISKDDMGLAAGAYSFIAAKRTGSRKRSAESTSTGAEMYRIAHRRTIETKLSTPSNTTVRAMQKLQNEDSPAIKNLRWKGVQLAIGVLCPILGGFKLRCARRIPSTEAIVAATKLTEVGKEYYEDEPNQMTPVLNPILAEFFDHPVAGKALPSYESWSTLYSDKERGDGGMLAPGQCPLASSEYRKAPDAIEEEQCIRYHDRRLNQLIEKRAPVALSCYAPALTLLITGCHLRVGGVVRASLDIFEPLEQAEILPMWLQQPDAMIHLAKVLEEFRATCHLLHDFYAEVVTHPKVTLRERYMHREVPLCLQHDSYSNLALVYSKGRPHLWSYQEGADGPTRIAKIVRGEAALEVHKLWAKHKLAPAILPITSNKPIAEDSPWYCLHMEYLSKEDGWRHPADISPLLQSSAREAALAALETAHGLELKLAGRADNLKHTAVHGDARSPNILMHACDDGKWEVRFLDFDWAGPAGTAIYPVPLNPLEHWPESASCQALITREHDQDQVHHAFQLA